MSTALDLSETSVSGYSSETIGLDLRPQIPRELPSIFAKRRVHNDPIVRPVSSSAPDQMEKHLKDVPGLNGDNGG
jgi:hypothetical protein